ncbi:efflux RND transporter periplasmic adaptor subunit [Polaribacter sp. R77954]|uniref:efflux RND transporter periplasmic adaptor subunit n=1 Tax=Polaribacter sp. R77954 TaxID=3093870 RepID=UPI0037C8BA0A
MKNLYLFLVAMLFLACGNTEKTTETITEIDQNSNQIKITKQQFESQQMQFGQLTAQPFNSVVKANGFIDVPPENRASISTFIGGYVKEIPLLIGDKVKKGQFIASLTSTEIVEIQQQFSEISAQLAYLKNEYKRQKTLFDEKITSEKKYLKAESTYKSSLALYNGLHQKLTMLNINPQKVAEGKITSTINLYAPISGYVTEVNVSNGSFVSSASELLEIINTDHIHLELNVFEKDILHIKKDQDIIFKVPESSNKNYEAEIHLVGTSINNDRTIKVHGHLKDERVRFITGMFVEADIIISSKKAISIAKSAVLKSDTNAFILTLIKEESDHFVLEKTLLKLGVENEKHIEVLNFETLENKKILTSGVFMLSDF